MLTVLHQRAGNNAAPLRSTNWFAYLTAALLCLIALPTITEAHELRPAIVELTYSDTQSDVSSNDLNVEIIVNLESLIAGIGPEHENTDSSKNAELYKKLRSLDENLLVSEFERFQAHFISAIKISEPDGRNINLTLTSVDIPSVGNTDTPRDSIINLNAALDPNTVALRWQWSEAFGEVIVRANSDAAPVDFATLLSPGQQTNLIKFTQPVKQSRWQILSNYVVIGFEHILPKGTDHILFVVGLFLLTSKWRALALQVTAFTLAHSITLALGASGILRVSSSVVEPLIALSIVFICVENLFTKKLNKWRITVVFLFGLLHGLGFAAVLDEVGLDSNNFLIALLGFNVGVELGQLAIVTGCLITIGYWFGKKTYYYTVFTRPASVAIGLIGLYWFLQRTFL